MNVAELVPLLKPKDAAKILCISIFSLRRLVADGSLRCVRLSDGGQMRFDVADVRRFIEQHKA